MTTKSQINRREFLLRSTAALTTGSHLISVDGLASNAGSVSSRRSQPGEKIVGCYCTIKDVVNNQKYIDALQKKLGINTLLCSFPIKMPDWLQSINPADNKRSHRDDDTILHKAIEETHNRGMDFWQYHYANHHYYRELGRHIMSETFDGVKFADLPQIPYALSQDELTTCFEKPKVKAYEKELFGYASRTYDVDNMYVSHTRYATPSFWTNLFGCACSDCRKAAYLKGYDFEKMRKSMQSLQLRLERLDKKTLEYASQHRLIFTDFLTMIGEDDGVLDWFYFRAGVVGDALKRIHDSIHTSTNHRCGFVTDTHNATMSLLVGHNFEDLINGGSDGLHPLSWCAYQHISVIAAWANQLCEWVSGLEEATALKIVTAFFGWDEIGLPSKKIADLSIGKTSAEHPIWTDNDKGFYGYFNPDLTIKLMTHEWTRMAVINRGRIPTHPVIKGFEWPEKVCRELIDQTEELELDGYVFQRTENLVDK